MGGLVVALAIGLGAEWRGGERSAARAFMPGELGREPGAAAPGASGRAYLTRAMYAIASEGGDEWGKENGLTAGLNFSHNLRWIFPPSLFAEHPEFFPLENGQRLHPPENSYFWQPDIARPDVAAFAAAAANRFFEENPRVGSYALGMNDGLRFGESEELIKLVEPAGDEASKWFRGRPDYSPLVFTFMNRVADDVAEAHPDKLLGTLAYYWCENAPPFPVRQQVVPYLTADRAQGYDAGFWREEALLQRRWVARKAESNKAEVGEQGTGGGGRDKENGGRLGVYDYLYGGGFLIPRIHTRLLADNLWRARRTGFTDYFAETHFNWGLDGPMPWLAARLLQDPEQSPAALLEEYYSRFFGTAAVSMRRFFERCERQWMTQGGAPYWLKHFRDESQAAIFPSEMCGELRGLLEDARMRVKNGPADPARQRAIQRVVFMSEAFGVTERFVAMQEARVELARRVLRRAENVDGVVAALRRFVTARREFETYTRALQEREPLAVPEFEWGDYLRDDPVPAALREIGRRRDAGNGEIGAEVEALGIPKARRILNSIGTESDELLHDGTLEGDLRPAKVVAGLPMEVALPPAWLSWAEPCEHFFAERIDRAPPVLRLSGNKETQIFQWGALANARGAEMPMVVARVSVHGHVSPGGAVSIVLGWLDGDNARLGLKTMRLPEGDWPEWVELETVDVAPAGAVWAGIGLRVQNQAAGDWIEVRQFSLGKMH